MRALASLTLSAGLRLSAAVALTGCAAGGPPLDRLSELDTLARGPNRAVAYVSALVTVGSLVPFAPDENVLNALSMRIGTETSECAQRSIVGGTTLNVKFESAAGAGCTLATGVVKLSGTATITLSRQDPRLDISSMLDLMADGESMTGSLVVSTTTGNDFDLTALLQLDGVAWKLLNFRGSALNQGTAITASGTATSPTGGTRILEYQNVQQRFYGCHPYGGAVRLSAPAEGLDRTLSFLDETPQSDTAQYTDNGVTQAVTLPRAAGCSSGLD